MSVRNGVDRERKPKLGMGMNCTTLLLQTRAPKSKRSEISISRAVFQINMEIAGQNFVGFRDWKIKVTNLKERIKDLESREMDYVLIYVSVMQNVSMQFGGLVAVSLLTAGLFHEFNYFVGLGLILEYHLFIAYHVYSGKKNTQALKRSICEIIAERKRLYRSCTRILSEYDNVCVVASPFRDSQVSFTCKYWGPHISWCIYQRILRTFTGMNFQRERDCYRLAMLNEKDEVQRCFGNFARDGSVSFNL
ncbi:hypothetical protein POM88_038173 [Heracleum sosnowskyi]|uniref:Uncharacterized protein n=1 Tax=Heracleum sosnowskyi TaxID=360622 RepID=A0AAD8HRW8_9APIA|nr:hypothetical protein POM88_038173 [Heracleum sosnowskyi]